MAFSRCRPRPPWIQVTVRALNIARKCPACLMSVSQLGGRLQHVERQDFALVVYNAATNTLSDVPNLTTNNACQTAMLNITGFPFSFTNTLSTVAV